MIRDCVHDGGVVDVLLQCREGTALTAPMSLFVAEPADDVGGAAFVAFAFAFALPFAGLLAFPIVAPMANVASKAGIPVAKVGSLGGLFALAATLAE